MMTRRNGGYAFPVAAGVKDAYGNPTNTPQTGMSLRAYFAGQALAFAANRLFCPPATEANPRQHVEFGDAVDNALRAKWAVAQADALIAALDE